MIETKQLLGLALAMDEKIEEITMQLALRAQADMAAGGSPDQMFAAIDERGTELEVDRAEIAARLGVAYGALNVLLEMVTPPEPEPESDIDERAEMQRLKDRL